MDQLHAVVNCVVLAFSVAAASFTIARTKITLPLRQAIANRSTWFGNLLQCPYCVSHWLALAAVLVFQPRPINHWLPVDLLAAWFFVVAVSAGVIGVIGRAIAPPPPPSHGPL